MEAVTTGHQRKTRRRLKAVPLQSSQLTTCHARTQRQINGSSQKKKISLPFAQLKQATNCCKNCELHLLLATHPETCRHAECRVTHFQQSTSPQGCWIGGMNDREFVRKVNASTCCRQFSNISTHRHENQATMARVKLGRDASQNTRTFNCGKKNA